MLEILGRGGILPDGDIPCREKGGGAAHHIKLACYFCGFGAIARNYNAPSGRPKQYHRFGGLGQPVYFDRIFIFLLSQPQCLDGFKAGQLPLQRHILCSVKMALSGLYILCNYGFYGTYGVIKRRRKLLFFLVI